MAGMTSDFGAFQQPIIFVICSSESGVIWGEGRTMPIPGCEGTLGASFSRGIDVDLSALSKSILLSANSRDCMCGIPHVGSSPSQLINLNSASLVVCIFGANTF